MELHILELNKVLTGRRVDEWIRLFNVETEEDLEMLETMTRNPGILEAVKEVRHMSLGKWARARYDEHMKMVRDQNARDAYVRDEGINIGVEQERNRLANLIARMNIRKPIKNQFIQSFLYYVPYVTLAVMTFPAIIHATQTPISGLVALIAGIIAAWLGAGLFPVSVICCVLVFVIELFVK